MDQYLSIMLGAVAGCVLPYIAKVFLFIIKRHSTEPIHGCWSQYLFWTVNGKVVCAKMMKTIKKGILSEYSIKSSDSADIYIGSGYIENGHLCTKMKLKSGGEDTTYGRYNLTALRNRDVVCGLWLSYDADGKVSCGATFLSKNDSLSQDEIDGIIEANYKIDNDTPVISLKY